MNLKLHSSPLAHNRIKKKKAPHLVLSGLKARPPALTYIPEPYERVSEKAQRINLQLLQLSRHTLLYLSSHACLWAIKKAAHMYADTQCPFDETIKQTVTTLLFMCLYVFLFIFGGLKFSICSEQWICDRQAA